jgi:DnaD/phage-associated family protein
MASDGASPFHYFWFRIRIDMDFFRRSGLFTFGEDGVGRFDFSACREDVVRLCRKGLSLSEELIEKAYETTVEKTGKYSVSYMNTVLRSWHTRGISSVKDLENEKTAATPKKSYSSKKTQTKLDAGKYAEYSWEILKNETENLD